MKRTQATHITTVFAFAIIGAIASSGIAKDLIATAPSQPWATDKSTSAPAIKSLLTAVAIDAPTSSIPVAGAVQLTATSVDETGSALGASTTWSSSNTAIAAVNATGLVTGVASGAAAITASASATGITVSTTITINVMPQWTGAPPPPNVLVNDPSKGTVPNIAQKEPTIAVFGPHVVVGWNDWAIEFGQTLRGIKNGVGHGFSADGGATFTDAGEVGTSHWGADPTLAVDRSGNFYFGRIDLQPGSATFDRIAVFKSTDWGATFPESATASNPAEPEGNDAPTIVVDTTASPFSGTVYAIWAFKGTKPRFSRSTDGGASFSTPIALTNRGVPAVGPNGEIYVLGTTGGSLVVTKSTDGGLSFGPSVPVTSVIPIGHIDSATAQYCGSVLNGSLNAGGSSRIAVDTSGGPDNGMVYVVFSSHGVGPDEADVFLTKSSDGGATWSIPSRLNDDTTTNDQWMPFVAVAPNGSVAVSWYDRRLDPQNLLIDLFMRISPSGGASFGPNMKITEVSFPPPGINYTLGFPPYTCYFESYNWITADVNNFYLVWTDDRRVRSSMIDPNIFFAKVPVPSSANYEGLWWASPAGSESGWGINLAHQGDVIFATWFTYDATGKAWWLTMTANKTSEGVYSGTFYQTGGPAFGAVPFDPQQVTHAAVGTGTLTFSGANSATFAYTVNGVTQTKSIAPQVFGPLATCVWGQQADLTKATNYQDLWWAAPAGAESGWGVNITQEGATIFATWFTYDVNHNPLWYSVTATGTTPNSFSGTLFRTTGPPFNAMPFNPALVKRTAVGTAMFTFSDGNAGTFAYQVNDGANIATQTKTITRQVFRAPGTVCQ